MSCRKYTVLFACNLCLPLIGYPANGEKAADAVYPAVEALPYSSARSGGNYLFNYYLPPAGNSSPWWVSWAPDGTELFFSIHGALWKVASDGGIATEIRSSSEYLSSPTISPNGRFLAYASEESGVSINLRILDLKTGRDTPVTDDEYVNVDPAWSPDGRRLAFVSTRNDGHFHIYIAKVRDGKARAITSITHVPGTDNVDPETGRRGMHISPTWSADGRQLVFVWNRNAERGSGGLWAMDATEHGIRSATLVHQEESVYRLRPDVSPDGSRIVYSSYAGEQFNNLYLLPVSGGVPYKLSFDTSDAFHPQWSPDGRRIAYVSNRNGTSALRIRDAFSGADTPVDITALNWTQQRAQLTVRTIDADSGKPIGARIYVSASDGKSYAPNGEYHRIARRLGEHYFHGRGTFDLDVPPGPLKLEAHRGFEYYPTGIQLQLSAGGEKTVTVALKRMHDASSDGWYSGDNHVHMNYGGNLHNSPENLVGMADAEGLAVVNALVANKYTRIIDHQYYSGEPHPVSTQDAVLFFNQEYRSPFYGHISLLGPNDHLVSPFAAGLDGTAIESLYPSNTDVLLEASRQNALGGYVHPFRGPEDPILSGFGGAKAFPVDLALGTLGFHELTSQASWGSYTVWHHALNAGFRVPIVGGEDAISDLHRMYVLGQLRTYASLAGELSWKNWLDAVRNGNTVVTNGPLLELTLEDSGPGDELHLDEPGSVLVKGTVRSIVPVDNVDLVVNGESVSVCAKNCTRDPDGPGTLVAFEREIPISDSSWITLQASTIGPVHPIDDHFVQATTNAIWVTVDDRPIRNVESIQYFRRWIGEIIALVDVRDAWRSDDEKQHVLEQFRAANESLASHLRDARQHCGEEALSAEALIAIDRKLRSLNDAEDSAVQYGVWLGDACSGRMYSVNSDAVIPAASSIKAALLIEFFAEHADQLDEAFSLTEDILLDPDSPAIRHFDAKTARNVRHELVRLSVREIGEAMISKKHVSSNAAYNVAANVVISALGGPAAATEKIRSRYAGINQLTISRYMLADRHETGDNVVTLDGLAEIHRSLAIRDVPGVDAATIDAMRSALEIDAGNGQRQFYKGGTLSSDPQVRIEAGWLQVDDDPVLIYAIAASRTRDALDRRAEIDALGADVADLSAIAKSALGGEISTAGR